MDHAAGVQVTELQTDRGDGQLDVGGGGRQTHALPQHPAQLRVRPASVVVGAALTLAHSVDTLLGYVGPEEDKTSNKTPGWRLDLAPYLVSKSRTFILVLTPTQPIYRTA